MTHGTISGYTWHGCRCDACTRAQRVRMREYRKRRTTGVPSDRLATNHLENQSDPATAATVRGHGNQEGPS